MITGESDTKTLPSFLAAAMEKASKEELSAALQVVLAPYFLTTFRAARAQDHEVAAIRAMQTLGALGPGEDEHDWMLRLRVTRAKARNLVYQVHLHQLQDEAVLDDEVRRVMAKPIIEKGRSGQRDTHWVLDIPNPLVMERIRQRVRWTGFVSDGSFSPSIVKLPVNAYAAVAAELVPKDEQKNLLSNARKLAHDSEKLPLGGVLAQILRHGGGKLAGTAGAQLSDELTFGLEKLLNHGDGSVLSRFCDE